MTLYRKLAWAMAAALWMVVIATLSGGVHAGPLEPPGSPAPTMKTLQEVEPRTPISSVPFTISTSGAYYLTSNLTCTTCSASVPGILVDADNVSIDLMGFTLSCAGPCGGRGVEVSQATTKIVQVRNGTVREWLDGVRAFEVVSSVFENLTLYNNSQNGIYVNGENNVIRNCVAQYNSTGLRSLVGAQFVGGSVIEGCHATLNNIGITVSINSLVRNNHVTKSTNRGIHALGSANVIQDNNVTGSTNEGIVVNSGTGNLIVQNSASSNGTNYSIVAGNTVGPIGTADTATSPWANVTY